MSKTFTACFKKVSKLSKDGYLNIRITENRKSIYEPLGIKINQKHWNINTKRVKSSYGEGFEHLNQQIETRVNELNNNASKKDVKKHKSLMHYWQNEVVSLGKAHNYGTKAKYQNIINKFQLFLKEEKQWNDLLFKDLNATLIKEFINYLKVAHKTPNEKGGKRKSMSDNTINHYVKVLKGVVNLAEKEDVFTYSHNQFNSISFKNKPVRRSALRVKELKNIVKMAVPKDLQIVKYRFLFQIFAQGMRVSDIQLLKWKNIKLNKIEYTVYKRPRDMSIGLKDQLVDILLKILNIDPVIIEEKNHLNINDLRWLTIEETELDNRKKEASNNPLFIKYKQKVEATMKSAQYISLTAFKEEYGKNVPLLFYSLSRHDETHYFEQLTQLSISLLKKEHELLSFCIERKCHNVPIEIHPSPSLLLDSIKEDYLPILAKAIDLATKSNKLKKSEYIQAKIKSDNLYNQYIFGFFDEDLEGEALSKKLSSNTVYYDKKLHQLQKLCEVETNISSHVARHTYSSHCIYIYKMSIYELMMKLGHSSVKTTEKYISVGFTNSDDEENNDDGTFSDFNL
ncbi:MAG: hypothetical protein CFE24_15200 [Flavobacterium sp. BFFFF2]|nr:MAG: hypothetical protein CFE24_15200 [Flavobacterium sp. BFFFF2]